MANPIQKMTLLLPVVRAGAGGSSLSLRRLEKKGTVSIIQEAKGNRNRSIPTRPSRLNSCLISHTWLEGAI